MTEHFDVPEEFTASDTAAACGIDNSAPPEIEAELNRLAVTMEAVRIILDDKPITITSGYRCPDLNLEVGGASNSAHCAGRACDFVCPEFGIPYKVVEALIPHREELRIDQLIYECGVDGEGDEWVHLAIAGDGEIARNEVLTITQAGTFTGLVATA